MTQRLERKLAKAKFRSAIKAARGCLRSKSGELLGAEQIAKRNAEDHELEHRRDKRLAALFKK